jgi:predicted nucleotidyltransferase
MDMTTATISEPLKQRIIAILRQHDGVHAGIFGSFARGEADDESDMDFLIEYEDAKIKTLLELERLAMELEEALGREVDVATYQALNPRIREQVLCEEVVLL